MTPAGALSVSMQQELLAFAQQLVRIQSLSGREEAAVRCAAAKMQDLGYDEVTIDAMGNVVGRIGDGGPSILFDSHLDTVAVNDPEKWDFDPFGGDIVDGMLRGRGSVDMKAAAAASVFAAAAAKRAGHVAGKTVYVSCSVFEEDCDGENLKHMFDELSLRPDAVLICEPSANRLALGHKGKAQIAVTAHGTSSHSSAPEKGVNAIYEMAEIIQRIEAAGLVLMQQPAPRGTLVMSRITSTSASLNAVPSECEVYLDRRLVPGETLDNVKNEMDRMVHGKNAVWRIGTLHRKSWTGMDIAYEPFHPAWEIDLDHDLTRTCTGAFRHVFGSAPDEHVFWDFSTNAVTPVSLGIPTIGFGPGDYTLAHMPNEQCPVGQIVDACRFYARVIHDI